MRGFFLCWLELSHLPSPSHVKRHRPAAATTAPRHLAQSTAIPAASARRMDLPRVRMYDWTWCSVGFLSAFCLFSVGFLLFWPQFVLELAAPVFFSSLSDEPLESLEIMREKSRKNWYQNWVQVIETLGDHKWTWPDVSCGAIVTIVNIPFLSPTIFAHSYYMKLISNCFS